MHFSLRATSAAFGGVTLILALVHCVADDPSVDNPTTSNDGGSNDGTTATGDGSSGGDGGNNDSGPTSCVPVTGLQPGAVDTTYSGHSLGVANFIASNAAIDSKNRVVVVGTGDCPDSTSSGKSLVVMRFKADGTLDTSFNSSGSNCATFDGNGFAGGMGLAVAAGGDIIAVGFAPNSGQNVGIAWFTDSGALDTGIQTTGHLDDPTLGQSAAAAAIALRPGDKPIISGVEGAVATGFLSAYRADGTNDSTFQITRNGAVPSFTSVAIGDGGVYAVGASGTNLFFWQTDSNGVPFNDAGVSVPLGGSVASNVIAVGSNALAAGFDIDNKVKVAMLNGSGVVTSFGTNGIAAAPNTATTPDQLTTAVAAQCDGKIVTLGGTAQNDGGAGVLSLGRLEANGQLDTTFGTAGSTTFTANTIPVAVLTTSDGYLIVVSKSNPAPDNAIVQLTRFSQ